MRHRNLHGLRFLMAANEVRIIGGNWRGRKLSFPPADALRPSLGRVRETLFNWLRDRVEGSRCLDLYAGSGALGFEALSRGAAEVTFVDRNPRVVRALRENAARLGVADCVIVCSPARRFLQRVPSADQPDAWKPWNIIFLDPPFAGNELSDILTLIRERSLLARNGVVYVEASRRATMPLAGWEQLKHSVAGDSQFGLLAPPAEPC